MKNNYQHLEEIIISWGQEKKATIKEIFVIGSMASTNNYNSKKKSDFDLLIYLDNSADKNELYKELSIFGLETSILIHPLFIYESEIEYKQTLPLYKKAMEKKRKIV